MRLGVLADTHLYDHEARLLVPLLGQVWGHVDLVLHAGDVTSPLLIESLNEWSPTHVVAGNMDIRADISNGVERAHWPRTLRLSIGGYQIGLTHGDFMRFVPAVLPPLWRRSRQFDVQALHAYLRAQFDHVQVIVFGHTHRAHCDREGGVLFFNPGALHGQADSLGSVGMLTIAEQGIAAEIISLAGYRLA